MTMPKALAFDFDGVIVNSNTIKTDAFRHLFAAWPEHLDEIVRIHRRYGGISRHRKFDMIYKDLLKQPLSEEKRKQLGEEFSAYVFDAVLACPLVEGAEAFLEEWAPRRPIFVISGTPDGELKEIVKQRGLDRFFTEVHGSPSTKPDVLRDIMARHGIDPSDMPYIGDAPSDEEAARTCGLRFVGVAPDGVGPFTGPDAVIRDLTGLAAALGA